ncbi:hypothetical protein, partial [Marinospirillum sp.]|uniref:hypothetical protein n=1 Tax=Marinospirillum sp. TaxID=2183934 RepID=UPI0025BC9B58
FPLISPPDWARVYADFAKPSFYRKAQIFAMKRVENAVKIQISHKSKKLLSVSEELEIITTLSTITLQTR